MPAQETKTSTELPYVRSRRSSLQRITQLIDGFACVCADFNEFMQLKIGLEDKVGGPDSGTAAKRTKKGCDPLQVAIPVQVPARRAAPSSRFKEAFAGLVVAPPKLEPLNSRQ